MRVSFARWIARSIRPGGQGHPERVLPCVPCPLLAALCRQAMLVSRHVAVYRHPHINGCLVGGGHARAVYPGNRTRTPTKSRRATSKALPASILLSSTISPSVREFLSGGKTNFARKSAKHPPPCLPCRTGLFGLGPFLGPKPDRQCPQGARRVVRLQRSPPNPSTAPRASTPVACRPRQAVRLDNLPVGLPHGWVGVGTRVPSPTA